VENLNYKISAKFHSVYLFYLYLSFKIKNKESDDGRSYKMAKKFGKFLLFVTSTCAIAAGVYYYLQKKENEDWDEEDFDDFDDEDDDFDDEDSDFEGRTYVPLNTNTPATKPEEESGQKETADVDSEEAEPVSEQTDTTFTEDYFDEEDEFIEDSETDTEEA